MYLWEASPPGLTGPLSRDVRRRRRQEVSELEKNGGCFGGLEKGLKTLRGRPRWSSG